jgi:leucine efflux protein
MLAMVVSRSIGTMFEIQNYGSFVAAICIFQLVPGPGTIAILSATARGGKRVGLAAVLGTLLGDFIYMIAAAAGLAAVMQANTRAFAMLQWIGAAYLCWIGVGLLRARIRDEQLAGGSARSALTYFRTSIAVSLTNPKVILFFVAFFPLFLQPGATRIALVALMAHVTLISLAYQCGLVFVGHAVADRLKTFPPARRLATRLAGIALVGFGIKLAIDNR